MAKTLTKEQKKAYLQKGGVACPYCKSMDLVGGRVEIGYGEASQGCECFSCNKFWRDVYKLVAVEEVDNG